MGHICISAGLSLTSVATLLSILALVLNYWEKTTGTNGIYIHFEIRRGLWEICTRVEYRSRVYTERIMCMYNEPNVDNANGQLLVLVRASMILAVMSLIGSLVCTLLKLCLLQDNHRLINVAWILSFIGGTLLLCAFGSYINIRHMFKDYMVAFYLSVIAWSMAWTAGVFIFFASRTFHSNGVDDT